MNPFALMQGINAVFSASILIVILFKEMKTLPQKAFACWTLYLFLYSSTYFLWATSTDRQTSLFWLWILLFPVAGIHVAYFHFTLAFCGKISKYKQHLICAYLSGALCTAINVFNGFIDLNNVRTMGLFLFWPHANPTIWLLIACEIYFVSLGFYVLLKSIEHEPEPLRPKLKIFAISSLIAWSGGLTNWFPFFDAIPIMPVGNVFICFYVGITAYLVLKHDLLGLNLAIRKTFVYGSMTLVVTLIYIVFVVLSERLFQRFLGYSSFIGTGLAALTIAALFDPIRNVVIRLIDKRFFGKTIVDLSEENSSMKAELQKQDKLKAVATLSAGIVHEIKNPLTSISTFAEHLPQKYDDPGFREKFSHIVKNECARMNQILSQLLDFSKPEIGRRDRVDLSSLIDDTLQLLATIFSQNNVTVEKDLCQEAFISADRNKLKQVFLNIVINAVQAMPSGGTISVSCTLRGNTAMIKVQDSGAGIKKEDLGRVFDPFYTTKPTGTGLGLSIVHGIVQEHAGNISIKSTPSIGTQVELHFPISDLGAKI